MDRIGGEADLRRTLGTLRYLKGLARAPRSCCAAQGRARRSARAWRCQHRTQAPGQAGTSLRCAGLG